MGGNDYSTQIFKGMAPMHLSSDVDYWTSARYIY